MGAVGLIGAMASILVMLRVVPSPTSSLSGYAAIRIAAGAVSTWVFLPALVATLMAGLLAMAFNQGFQTAGWAWVKLATGVLVFEAGFTGIQGPMQAEAARSAAALAGRLDPASLARSLWSEEATLGVLLFIATANVVLGVWRPRFDRKQMSRR